ncbi:hypothetical protein K1T71_007197 [Dendrolimus kikuchii]|uniref:Uncharacterized protein n=1 Tax=Dendrolimus kikuchii TaxID=765133 RepID=A0ACC1CZS6_9NEOP|nr:hypothetical protein K1T71_007197 [Dendrolimus kikuchii]
MIPKLKIINLMLLITLTAFSAKNENSVSSAKQNNKYAGEKFPTKYLYPDYRGFSVHDIDYYLRATKRTINYFSKFPNDTDVNTATGVFYVKVILAVTLRDYADILNIYQIRVLKNIVGLSDYILSHYIYMQKEFGWDDIEHRVSRIYQQDRPFMVSIEQFNRNRLKKWLLTHSTINDFLEQMDDVSLPKETYVWCVSHMDAYYSTYTSGKCLSRISLNAEPIDYKKLSQCKQDEECMKQVETTPSVAYALSHRLFYLSLSKYVYRCNVFTQKKTNDLIDMMCAQMYRESVYIARRGYFARDMFLEHIALCGTMGYEEFFRRPWFLKAASWVDDIGCVREFYNFDINRSRIITEEAVTPRKREIAAHQNHYYLTRKCHKHTMAVGVAALAQGVRHSVNLMKTHLFSL